VLSLVPAKYQTIVAAHSQQVILTVRNIVLKRRPVTNLTALLSSLHATYSFEANNRVDGRRQFQRRSTRCRGWFI